MQGVCCLNCYGEDIRIAEDVSEDHENCEEDSEEEDILVGVDLSCSAESHSRSVCFSWFVLSYCIK